jgi:hypothetical protein
MSGHHPQHRRFTRIELDLPVAIHQGGSVWHQRLIDICLSGLSTTQPDVWDAQYNEPFTVAVQLEDGGAMELHAYLQHVEAGRLGFDVQHVDRENLGPLRTLLGAHMDIAVLEEELRLLET